MPDLQDFTVTLASGKIPETGDEIETWSGDIEGIGGSHNPGIGVEITLR